MEFRERLGFLILALIFLLYRIEALNSSRSIKNGFRSNKNFTSFFSFNRATAAPPQRNLDVSSIAAPSPSPALDPDTLLSVPALFVIGDSTADCGTNNFLLTLARADRLPYGRDFDTHRPTGRFCNGRIPVDYLGNSFLWFFHYVTMNLRKKLDMFGRLLFAI